MKLNIPFLESNTGQMCLSYLGPKIWNSLSFGLNFTNDIKSFMHKNKEIFSAERMKQRIGILQNCVLLFISICNHL